LSPRITDDANQIDDGPEDAREGFQNGYANLEASFFQTGTGSLAKPVRWWFWGGCF
jgi:hypothetical protein